MRAIKLIHWNLLSAIERAAAHLCRVALEAQMEPDAFNEGLSRKLDCLTFILEARSRLTE